MKRKKTKKSEIQIWTFENPWGGLNFSKMSEIDPRGGVSLFGKKSAIFPFFNYDASPKSNA